MKALHLLLALGLSVFANASYSIDNTTYYVENQASKDILVWARAHDYLGKLSKFTGRLPVQPKDFPLLVCLPSSPSSHICDTNKLYSGSIVYQVGCVIVDNKLNPDQLVATQAICASSSQHERKRF